MKTIRKLASPLRCLPLLVLLLSSCKLQDMAKIGSRFAAKEMCSCVFVMERSKEFCHGLLRSQINSRRFIGVEVDFDMKSVSASIWKYRAMAQWQSPYEGCQLTFDDATSVL
ncbi:MAG: hypothetical protein OXB88_05885 [Bacteriovoracales bacterium]|nr:hypothetical protein [Bacteriovoracales bacterium]